MIILSGELKALSGIENLKRTNTLRLRLQREGYSFKEALGRFQGVDETSFVVNSNDTDSLLDIANKYDQISILLVDDISRDAYLVDSNGKSCYVGIFQLSNRDEALANEAFTMINEAFYVIK